MLEGSTRVEYQQHRQGYEGIGAVLDPGYEVNISGGTRVLDPWYEGNRSGV